MADYGAGVYGASTYSSGGIETIDVASIVSDERWAPLQPRTGLVPGPGLAPDSGGLTWVDLIQLGSIASSEAWGVGVETPTLTPGTDFTVSSIPSSEDWDTDLGLHPRVGLYPGAGLFPQRAGLTWADIQHPGSMGPDEGWGAVTFEAIDSIHKIVRGVLSSSLALVRSQPFR